MSRTSQSSDVRWMSLPVAAEALGLSAEALRKTLDRRAKKVADGGTEAVLDGVRARKLGRLWRVTLGAAWTLAPRPTSGVRSTSSQSPAEDREGTRS